MGLGELRGHGECKRRDICEDDRRRTEIDSQTKPARCRDVP
jgi:hypothetical protein